MGETTAVKQAAPDAIRFVLDGELIELRDVDPTRTVLQFLREDLGRTGTKEGCAEGDCGACTVVVADVEDDEISLEAINSCIQFLPTLDGKELMTVESLSGVGDDLHPVQRAMVEHHGSQCGFCTPGFVMSLFALYKSNAAPGRRDIDDALAGNLCRCTGYRPIVAAAMDMYRHARGTDDWLRQPAGSASKPDRRMHRLRSLDRGKSLAIEHGGRRFFAPQSGDELAALLLRYPEATLLAGGTDVGLWVTKQHRELETVVHTGRVAELRAIVETPTHIEIGAAVTLSEVMPVILGHYPLLEELFLRFASPPIRNAATLGGNIANGSPIGDSMPVLMAAGTTVVLRSGNARRELTLEDFYVDYQVNDLAPGEFVETVRVPLATDGVVLQTYKISKRFDQDISAVCAGYRLELDGERVASIRIACGGLAATIRRARHCERALAGKTWDSTAIEGACRELDKDFSPITDMRASGEYRLRVCKNLLWRFFLETSGAGAESVYAYGR